MSDDPSGLLARWSQRKHAAREAERGRAAPAVADDARRSAEAATAPLKPAEESPPAGTSEVVQARTATDSDRTSSSDDLPALPALEDLDFNSDYTPFLSKGVPEALANAALRKLWLSDPVFANLDGLNDYDEDFTIVEELITSAQSSYKVGRGYLDEESSELNKTDEAAAGSSQVGSESREDGADATAEKENIAADNENTHIDAENNSPRPVAALEPDENGDAGEAGSDKTGDSINVSKA